MSGTPRLVGVGKGHAQGFGVNHHSYKNGTGSWRKGVGKACERCGSKKFLCAHHRDEDRSNNTEANRETLCKRCHQLHHGCTKELKPLTPAMRRSRSLWMKELNQISKRAKDGRILPHPKGAKHDLKI